MKIITTVGISIFENYFEDNPEDTLKDDYQDRLKDTKDNNATFEKWIEKNRYKVPLEEKVAAWSFNKQTASAEITSILAIAKTATACTVHLIATDTVLSVSAAELIQKWFEESEEIIEVIFIRPEKLAKQEDSNHIIHKLRVASNKDYQEGFMNLIEVVTKLLEQHKEEVILNITGGYKAIIPIMTLIGQLKNVSLKYIYQENELSERTELVEIGNLPISFDWNVVEALNPFLKAAFLSRTEIRTLGELWFANKIKFKNNKFLTEVDAIKLKLRGIPIIFHQVFNSLIEYNLLKWNAKEIQVEVNYLGELLKISNVGFEKGYIMELLLHKYFLTAAKNEVIEKYSLLDKENINKINTQLRATPHFRITDLPSKKIELVTKSKEIGDIDIPLREDKKIIWGESKAFSAATNYVKTIGVKKDYYLQLKARALLCNALDKKMENLMIIFRFVFKGINDTAPFLTTELNSILTHLKGLNADVDVNNATFKAIGVNIPLKFKGNKIDFTDFYKGEFKHWQWFEL